MSAAFAFLPRKIARSSKPPLIHPVNVSTTSVPTVLKGNEREPAPVEREGAQNLKLQYSEEDYGILLCLSLSNYRLWSDPDLRRRIEWSSGSNSNDGFFPLSHLLGSRCPLSAAGTSESLIVKALRAHATDIVDVRMAIPSSIEPGKKRGNFEIRPKFWDDAVYPVTREGWENRTVYVENIPVKHKTLASLCRFILGLLPPTTTMAGHNRIQGISLPSHHSDDPGTEPKFKSFAVITLADGGDVEFLLATWPWSRQPPHIDDSPNASDAAKFGFRTLSKARWDELNSEYLNYRAKIIAEAPAAATLPLSVAQDAPEPSRRLPSPAMSSAANMSYPQGCLVFVRNIHPETNKTTLRNFFAQAVDAVEAIDYVDFNKGIDSCYLRLTTASHAKTLVAHFAQNSTVHVDALDDSGTPSREGKSVEAELVLGKKEEVYWEKVPEKVCLQAVKKAL
ncbi:hypothetical protein B0H16DRAFT_1242813, partial [Mycena metata]